MRKGSHHKPRDLRNIMYASLIAKVEKLNEDLGLSFVLQKSARTGNKIEIYKRLKDGTMGNVYRALNCAQASTWIDGYVLGWATAMGK